MYCRSLPPSEREKIRSTNPELFLAPKLPPSPPGTPSSPPSSSEILPSSSPPPPPPPQCLLPPPHRLIPSCFPSLVPCQQRSLIQGMGQRMEANLEIDRNLRRSPHPLLRSLPPSLRLLFPQTPPSPGGLEDNYGEGKEGNSPSHSPGMPLCLSLPCCSAGQRGKEGKRKGDREEAKKEWVFKGHIKVEEEITVDKGDKREDKRGEKG